MRYCRNCGVPLQPEVTRCLQCGTFIPPSPQSVPNTTTTPSTAYRQQVPKEASAPTASSSSPVAGYYGTYSAQTAQAQPYYSPPSSFQPPLTKKTRQALGKKATLFLVLLALLIMFSGVALLGYTTITRPSQFRAQATATVKAIVTAQAQATSTTRAQARATAQAQARATATAQAQSQKFQSIYTMATSGTPALSSTLTAQDNANWSNYAAVGGGGCAFNNNALHASVFLAQSYVPCFAQGSNFSNFAFQVQMTILNGDGGGLVFRANEANVQLYLLRISHTGLLGISVSRGRKTISPILDDTSNAIKTGSQTNLITLIARNSSLSVYINKQFVDMISDTNYTTGEIGVFAYDSSTETDVAFNNATVWTL